MPRPDGWEYGEPWPPSPQDSYRHHREARVRLRALPAPWWRRLLWRAPDGALLLALLVALLVLAALARWVIA